MSKPTFTVTGPDADLRAESPEVGLSLAITLAERAKTDTTYYVRDKDGVCHARTERVGKETFIRRLT